MNLVTIYVEGVKKRLPRKIRKDVGDEIHATIHDMLPERYEEEDVKNVLAKLGDPVVLASKYRERPPQLIGPLYYDQYIFVLKLVMSISLVIGLFALIADNLYNIRYGTVGYWTVGIDVLFGLVSVVVHVFFWTTVFFLFLEKIGAADSQKRLTLTGEEWTPNDLKKVTSDTNEKTGKTSSLVLSLFWPLIWVTIYFSAVHLIGVREEFQMVIPFFNQSVLLTFAPFIVGLALIEMAIVIYKWRAKNWTIILANINLAFNILVTILFIVIATRPDLINQDFIAHMTTTLPEDVITPAIVQTVIDVLRWFVIFSVIVLCSYDAVKPFRKLQRSA